MTGLVRWLLGDTRECVAGKYTGDRTPRSRRGTYVQPESGLPEGFEPPSAALQPPHGMFADPAQTPGGRRGPGESGRQAGAGK